MAFHVPAPVDPRSGLTPQKFAPRNAPLFALARYRIEIDGERFPVSPPRRGDAARAQDRSWELTLGLAAADVPRLTELVGKTARLFEREDTEVLTFRVARVDRRLALLIADPRPSRE